MKMNLKQAEGSRFLPLVCKHGTHHCWMLEVEMVQKPFGIPGGKSSSRAIKHSGWIQHLLQEISRAKISEGGVGGSVALPSPLFLSCLQVGLCNTGKPMQQLAVPVCCVLPHASTCSPPCGV